MTGKQDTELGMMSASIASMLADFGCSSMTDEHGNVIVEAECRDDPGPLVGYGDTVRIGDTIEIVMHRHSMVVDVFASTLPQSWLSRKDPTEGSERKQELTGSNRTEIPPGIELSGKAVVDEIETGVLKTWRRVALGNTVCIGWLSSGNTGPTTCHLSGDGWHRTLHRKSGTEVV